MRIEFDPAKDSANEKKHGVSLALAEELDWDAALVWIDDRFENDEWRNDRARAEDPDPLLRGFCGSW
jgi:uncharacterized DUF497 family protein